MENIEICELQCQERPRARLMLFLPWRNEEQDLYGGYKTYEEHYMAKESLISPI